MLCRKMGWGSEIRRSRCSLSRPLDEIISPSPLCDGVRRDRSWASGSRRQRGASGCYAETPARLVGHWRRAEVLMHAKECVALSVTNRPRCHNSPLLVCLFFLPPAPPPDSPGCLCFTVVEMCGAARENSVLKIFISLQGVGRPKISSGIRRLKMGAQD